MNVQNELGVIVVFAQTCQQNGWKINHIQSEFPDAIIQDKDGETYRAEFEFCSSNFKAHRHDLFQCDVIICWEDDWDDCPLTVWSMKDWNDRTITIRDRKDLMIASLIIENERLKKALSKSQELIQIHEQNKRKATIDEWRMLINDLDAEQFELDANKVNEILESNGFAQIPQSTARYWAKTCYDYQSPVEEKEQ